MDKGYDILGDVHGMRQTLEALLARLGYRREGERWLAPPGRQAIFIGDLIDRGPDPLGSLEIAMEMQRDGCAQVLLGNHELNALLFMEGKRERSEKNLRQFARTLAQIEEDPRRAEPCGKFLLTCPLWLLLDRGQLRVVHACWEHEGLCAQDLPATLGACDWLTLAVKGGALHPLLECCLKGPERPATRAIVDTDGEKRKEERIPWWERYPPDAPTVVFGHYGFPWRAAPQVLDPRPLGPGGNALCVDFGAGRGERLVAYRYGGAEPGFVIQDCID